MDILDIQNTSKETNKSHKIKYIDIGSKVQKHKAKIDNNSNNDAPVVLLPLGNQDHRLPRFTGNILVTHEVVSSNVIS